MGKAGRMASLAAYLGRVLLAAMLAILIIETTAVAQTASTDGNSAFVDVLVESGADWDQDLLTDTAEKALGTDPAKADSDEDGLPDSFEVWNALDPLNFSDASADVDKDGLNNFEEYEAGTQPSAADTDGDAFWDGLEMARGSDPTLTESFPTRRWAADVSCDGVLDAMDLQIVINGVLGHDTPVPANVDTTAGLTAADVQVVVNALLGR